MNLRFSSHRWVGRRPRSLFQCDVTWAEVKVEAQFDRFPNLRSQNNWRMSGPIFYLGLSPMISSPQKTSPFSEAGPDERWKEENYFLKLDDRWKLVLMKTIFSNLRRDNRGLCSQLWLWVLPFERTILQLYLSVFIKYVNSNLIKLFEFFLLNGRSCNFIFFSLEFKTGCSSCLGFDLNWVNGWWSLPDTAWNRSIY